MNTLHGTQIGSTFISNMVCFQIAVKNAEASHKVVRDCFLLISLGKLYTKIGSVPPLVSSLVGGESFISGDSASSPLTKETAWPVSKNPARVKSWALCSQKLIPRELGFYCIY